MKAIFSLLSLLIFATSLMGQVKFEDDYLKNWEQFKKENAPFNKQQKQVVLFDIEDDAKEIKLGDLSYKRESLTVGQEIIGVALHVTAAIRENQLYKNKIWKDPAKYFVEGYY